MSSLPQRCTICDQPLGDRFTRAFPADVAHLRCLVRQRIDAAEANPRALTERDLAIERESFELWLAHQ